MRGRGKTRVEWEKTISWRIKGMTRGIDKDDVDSGRPRGEGRPRG